MKITAHHKNAIRSAAGAAADEAHGYARAAVDFLQDAYQMTGTFYHIVSRGSLKRYGNFCRMRVTHGVFNRKLFGKSGRAAHVQPTHCNAKRIQVSRDGAPIERCVKTGFPTDREAQGGVIPQTKTRPKRGLP